MIKMCSVLLIICLNLICVSVASPTRIEKLIVSKMKIGDLEASASGYTYNQQQSHPVSFLQYISHGTNMHYITPKRLQIVSSVLPPAPHISIPNAAYSNLGFIRALQTPNLPYIKDIDPALVKYKVHVSTPNHTPDKEAGENKNFEVFENLYKNSDESKEDDGEKLRLDSDEHKDHEPFIDVQEHHPGLESENYVPVYLTPRDKFYNEYESGSGKNHEAEDYNNNKEKDETKYEGYHHFDHGDKEEYSRDNLKGDYNEEEGFGKSFSENDAHYNTHEESDNGAKGLNYGQKSYRKKGEVTTGFHNVYSKDEYKENTDFYDEEHKSGNFEKYEIANEKHEAVKGMHEKGDNFGEGYERSDRKKSEQVDKGHDHSFQHNHNAKKGEDSYHNQHFGYGNKGDNRFDKKYEYGHGH